MNRTEHWLSPSIGPQNSIYIKRVAPKKPMKVPVLCVHGATIASTLFDADGASLLSDMAEAGHAAYAIDLRGYARSAAAMVGIKSIEGLRAEAGAEDVSAAINFICEAEQCAKVHLVGASWGSVIAGHLAATVERQRINQLILYAPLCDYKDEKEFSRLFGTPDLETLALTRDATWEAFWFRWQQEHSNVSPTSWLDSIAAESVKSSLVGNTPKAAVPNGCVADLAEVFSGRQLYDPSKIVARTLVLRGSLDPTSTRDGAISIFDRLQHNDCIYHEVANCAHFGLIERSGKYLRQAIIAAMSP